MLGHFPSGIKQTSYLGKEGLNVRRRKVFIRKRLKSRQKTEEPLKPSTNFLSFHLESRLSLEKTMYALFTSVPQCWLRMTDLGESHDGPGATGTELNWTLP